MLHFCVCIDLLHFMPLLTMEVGKASQESSMKDIKIVQFLTIYAVDRNLVAYCQGYIYG